MTTTVGSPLTFILFFDPITKPVATAYPVPEMSIIFLPPQSTPWLNVVKSTTVIVRRVFGVKPVSVTHDSYQSQSGELQKCINVILPPNFNRTLDSASGVLVTTYKFLVIPWYRNICPLETSNV